MMGQTRNPVEQAMNALNSTFDDVKTGAKAGAVKGAAAGAMGVLGAKAANAARNAQGSNGDLGKKARKGRKNAGKMLSQAADNAGKKASEASKKTDIDAKTGAAAQMLQMLGKRAGDTAQQVTDGGVHLEVNPNDVPRLLNGLTLLATGLGTLFAPGSALDVSRRREVNVDIDADELAGQARQGIDTAADMAQERIKDFVDVAKDALSSLSDALTAGIEEAENRAQHALDETESRLTQATEQAADTAKGAVPGAKKQKQGGSLRWLVFGVMLGGLVAFLSSPMSGSIGERVTNLRRDLGLGGDQDDDSQYWPSPPQSTTSETTTTPQASAGEPSGEAGKSEAWSETPNVKEKPNKA